MSIHWLGHAGFLIEVGGKKIYIDPFQLSEKKWKKGDLVISTHEHFDHCSTEDIKKITDKHTIIITVKDNQKKFEQIEHGEVKIVQPGDVFEKNGVKIICVAAYNIKKERLQFHPKEKNWIGVIVEIEGKRVYHTGDSDFIPEMKAVRDIDVMLIPVSGTYVMNYEDAAEAVAVVLPKKVIPMHFGNIVGTMDDAEKFKKAVEKKGIPVEILGKE